jgi:hypothetical protein
VKLVLGAGGTGGHVFPALALGIEMRELEIDVVWAGRQSSMDLSSSRWPPPVSMARASEQRLLRRGCSVVG